MSADADDGLVAAFIDERSVCGDRLERASSDATEAYDRGKKFQYSQKIDSLAEYVLVAQDQHRVERFLRQDGNEWLLTTTTGLESTVSLSSIQCTLDLAEIYDKVKIGPTNPQGSRL